jgi:hypothetical protein
MRDLVQTQEDYRSPARNAAIGYTFVAPLDRNGRINADYGTNIVSSDKPDEFGHRIHMRGTESLSGRVQGLALCLVI